MAIDPGFQRIEAAVDAVKAFLHFPVEAFADIGNQLGQLLESLVNLLESLVNLFESLLNLLESTFESLFNLLESAFEPLLKILEIRTHRLSLLL